MSGKERGKKRDKCLPSFIGKKVRFVRTIFFYTKLKKQSVKDLGKFENSHRHFDYYHNNFWNCHGAVSPRGEVFGRTNNLFDFNATRKCLPKDRLNMYIEKRDLRIYTTT